MGYAVTAIDAFADVQTVAIAEKTIVVTYSRQGFDANALMVALNALDLSRFIGFVYGSGFEAQPEMLIRIAEKLPLIGNAPDTVAAVKTPAVFFTALQQLNIHYPGVRDSLAGENLNDYLIKFAGGSGGVHISSAHSQACLHTDKYYYQKKVDGRPVSLLFLANKHDIEVIGFNEQWLSPSADCPYRYGGAVSHVALSDDVREQLTHVAQQLTGKFGLVGLNSLDAIIEADSSGQVIVLEINPRLSATVDLYSTELPLFERHVSACLNKVDISHDDLTQKEAHQLHRQCNAHAIVYAAVEIALFAPVTWPDWVTDIPLISESGETISAGEPVCSVLASADNADKAKRIAQSRVESIQNFLQSFHQKNV